MGCDQITDNLKFTSASGGTAYVEADAARDLAIESPFQVIFVFDEEDVSSSLEWRDGTNQVLEVADDLKVRTHVDLIVDGMVLSTKTLQIEPSGVSSEATISATETLELECNRSNAGGSASRIEFVGVSNGTPTTWVTMDSAGDWTFEGETFNVLGVADASSGRLVTNVYATTNPGPDVGALGAIAMYIEQGYRRRLLFKTGEQTWASVALAVA